MPDRNTFKVLPIKRFVEKHIAGAKVIVDPFANTCLYGTIRNDLNPSFDTDYHMDALDFLKMLPDESADVVLYDPPYSLRQVTECYKSVGREVTMETTQATWRSRQLDEVARITKRGGIALCFGWNSSGVGMKRGFDMTEILLVPHGGSNMLSNIKNGWARIQFEEFDGRVSYLTDILDDVTKIADWYLSDKEFRPFVLRFDAEDRGEIFLEIHENYSNLFIWEENVEGEMRSIQAKEMIAELLRDMRDNLHGWVYGFQMWEDDACLEEKELEYSSKIESLLERVEGKGP